MPSVINSANMNLPVPQVGVDSGPQWASDLNSCLAIIDGHSHVPGSGVPITPSAMNISSDLTMLNNNLIAIRSSRYTAQVAPLALASDLGCLYVSGVDLYFNDVSGNQVRITQNGNITGSVGSISNLNSPASASYVSGNQTFVWQSAANTAANMDAGSLILRNITANSFGMTINPPNAMGSNFSVTFPVLPSVQNIMTMDNSGNIGASWNVDNSTIEVAANVIRVKAGGIAASQIAAGTITTSQISASAGIVGTQLSASANIAGTQISNTAQMGVGVTFNNKLPIVSNSNDAAPMALIRCTYDGGGNVTVGTIGFISSVQAGGAVNLVFRAPFNGTPVAVISSLDGSTNFTYDAITQNHVIVRPGNVPFNMIIVGVGA